MLHEQGIDRERYGEKHRDNRNGARDTEAKGKRKGKALSGRQAVIQNNKNMRTNEHRKVNGKVEQWDVHQ